MNDVLPTTEASEGAIPAADHLKQTKEHALHAAEQLRAAALASTARLREAATTSAARLRETVGEQTAHAREAATQSWNTARSTAQDWQRNSEDFIRGHPTQTVLSALAIGFVLGLLFRR